MSYLPAFGFILFFQRSQTVEHGRLQHGSFQMSLRHIALFWLLALFLAVPAKAQDLSPERRADIEQLLRMTGAVSIGKQMGATMATQMTQLLKKVRPDIPDEVLQALPEEVMGAIDENIGSLINEMVQLHAKHFNEAEIKGLIAFYSTDLGKKVVSGMPGLVYESTQAGQRWGESIGPIVERRIKARFKRQGVVI
ncbi:DUF2059 domain-containing protein [Rhodoferax sp.]|uniref:DUF2059 domain-containing protein n=1 Tax=Rhodoferax sp. TaxID=50421 RepID=UPI003783B2A0